MDVVLQRRFSFLLPMIGKVPVKVDTGRVKSRLGSVTFQFRLKTLIYDALLRVDASGGIWSAVSSSLKAIRVECWQKVNLCVVNQKLDPRFAKS